MNARRAAPGILTACSEPWQRWLWPLLYLPFAALGLGIALTGDLSAKGGFAAMLLVGIATGTLWFGWFSRTLLLRIDTGAALVPGLAPAIARAMAGAFAASVLLPGSVLVFAGIEPAFAFGSLTAAAMAGLLVAWLPGLVIAALGILPMLLGILHDLIPQVPALRLAVPVLPEFSVRWLLLGCGLALLAWWRWRVLTRASTEGRAPSRWLQPVMLVPPIGRRRDEDGRPHAAASGQMPAWMWAPERIAAGVGPDTPVRALRVWLGAPFAPVAPRYWLIQAGFVALAALILLDTGFTAALLHVIVGGMAAAGLIGLFVGPIRRLEQLQQATSGEIAELALLPGLGGSASARALLLRAVCGARAWMLLLGLLALYAVLAVQGAGSGHYVLGTLIAAAGAATGAWLVLRALAARPLPKPGSVLLLLLALALLLPSVFTLFYPPAMAPPWLFAAWSGVLVIASVGLKRAWQSFQARAHPFVQE